MSGVPQGSVLGPIFFFMYINDLPSVLSNPCLLFADDTKVYSGVKSDDDIKRLQKDIDNLEKWSEVWQMPFNISKCKSLHLGYSNTNHIYSMGGNCIEQTREEKNLGVVIDNQLKFHSHVSAVTSKARRLLGLINKSFINLNLQTLPYLYKAIVRPTLEYGNVIWGPFYKGDENLIEQVQRKATRLDRSVCHLSYEERLKYFNLPSLKYRRYRGDMITTYNIIHGNLHLDQSLFFTRSWTNTRGHPFKLFKPFSTNAVRQHSYSQRIINDWNALPFSVVGAGSTNEFKITLDNHNKDNLFIY